MIRVGVAIMAHPAREKFVPSVLDALDAPAEVVWDKHQDRWETGARSMLAYRNDPDATHWLVVQDDAILCRDLVVGVTEAVKHVPENPLCLYTGNLYSAHSDVRNLIMASERAGSHWFAMEGPWWGVGVVVPVRFIEDLVAWGNEHPKIANYDRRMARYFSSIGVNCYYTHPSLVDHRQDHHSLVPGRVTKGRHAHKFIGADVSALTVDWSKLPRVGSVTFRSLKSDRTVTVNVSSRRAERLFRLPHAWVEVPCSQP